YREMPLFRLTEHMTWRAGHCFRGRFDGREVIAMEFEYQGAAPGRSRRVRRAQTIVVLPNVGDPPDFHARPDEREGDQRGPGGAGREGVEPAVAGLGGGDRHGPGRPGDGQRGPRADAGPRPGREAREAAVPPRAAQGAGVADGVLPGVPRRAPAVLLARPRRP